jgi:hypothetical protein
MFVDPPDDFGCMRRAEAVVVLILLSRKRTRQGPITKNRPYSAEEGRWFPMVQVLFNEALVGVYATSFVAGK